MSTDRELLELAAKAIGLQGRYRVGQRDQGVYQGILHGTGYTQDVWCPLDDDGDALQLAVALGMLVNIDRDKGRVLVITQSLHNPVHTVAIADDEMTATRRAIVRAAAEVGKGLLTQDEFQRMFPGRFPEAGEAS